MSDKKILAIIPARGGSKGVKRKNIRLLGGKPLIVWTIDAAKKSQYINRIVVSTEDDEITNVCQKEGVQVIKRPLDLAQAHSPTIESVLHVLEVLKSEVYIPDIMLLLQCTSPFRTNIQIDEAIGLFISQLHAFDSVISVEPNEYPPYWLKSVSEEGKLSDFIEYDKAALTRRQDFKKTYKLNGAIYVGTPDNVLNNKGFATDNSLAYMMDSFSSIDIDTETDFKYAEYLCGLSNDKHKRGI